MSGNPGSPGVNEHSTRHTFTAYFEPRKPGSEWLIHDTSYTFDSEAGAPSDAGREGCSWQSAIEYVTPAHYLERRKVFVPR